MTKIVVDQKKCIGCGMCTITAPKTFRLGKNGKSEVISQTAGSEKEVSEAIKGCPVQAISRKSS
jgi:ferredoxin